MRKTELPKLFRKNFEKPMNNPQIELKIIKLG